VSAGAPTGDLALVVTLGARSYAIPLKHVAEIMRPLAVEPMSGAPDFVRGLSVLRGAPVPVIDLEAILKHESSSGEPGRFVAVRLDGRQAVIGVDGVAGVTTLDPAELGRLPPILSGVATDVIDAIGSRDAQLLIVLRAARLIPAAGETALVPNGALA